MSPGRVVYLLCVPEGYTKSFFSSPHNHIYLLSLRHILHADNEQINKNQMRHVAKCVCTMQLDQ